MHEEDKNKDTNNSRGEEKHFDLPKNYFDSFGEKLFKKITNENELKEYPLLASLQKKNPFSVPSGYFESKEELFEYPLLASLKKNNSFAIPSDYFDTKEELLQYPLLAEYKVKSFAVPDTYFTTLMDAVYVEQEKGIYPLLYSHNKQYLFNTPANYFENFLVDTQPKTKVIPLYKGISKLSYRVAAAVTLLISLSILFYMQQEKPIVRTNDCNTFACLDKKDILNSGYVLHASDDNIIDLIDEKSLSDSLLLKTKGKTEKVDMNDVSDNVDINTLTDNL